MSASPNNTTRRASRPPRFGPNTRRALLSAAVLGAAASALWGFAVLRQTRGRLDEARARGDRSDAVRFERRRLAPLKREGVTLFQSTRTTRAVALFKDSYFAATDGGLVELSQAGQVKRRFSVLDGLDESDLTALAAYAGRLFIGTRSRGLVAFDGEGFEKYSWPDREAQAVSALLADEGKLLVGTFAGGLLQFDGEAFKELRAGEGRTRLEGVTTLARQGPRLYVGTFRTGLWITEGGRWAHFTTADGLKSDRVVGVVEEAGAALVATDFGVASAPAEGLVLDSESPGPSGRRRFEDVATIPSLSGVAGFAGRVLLCKDDGEVAVLDVPRGKSYNAAELVWTRDGAASGDARLLDAGGHLWLLGSGGLKRAARESRQISFEEFGEPEPAEVPTSNVISALAFDAGGRLWAGSFRDGLDVFAASGARLAHLETDELREINSLTPADAGGVLAGTSRGVARLHPTFKTSWLKTADGLASNSVMHVAPSGGEKGKEEGQLVAATSRGLSVGPPGRMRALTTVQGLPSNSVYTVWREGGERVYAGTLGGLAEVSAGRVVRVFKDSNSALTHNWVTAVRGASGRLFLGTYGGGVFELLPSGELRGFSSETGKAFVNPNAMWADDERLYVGTLEGALVLDLSTQKWRRLRAELPAATVLSVTGREGRVYFGTTGGLARFDPDFFKRAD